MRKTNTVERKLKTDIPPSPIPKLSTGEVKPSIQKPITIRTETPISIKSQLEEINKKSVVLNSDLPNESFSYDALKVASRQYAFITREAGMETFYHALLKHEPILENNIVTLKLDNQVQSEYIKPILQDYADFLKTQLKNGFIEVNLLVSESSDEIKKLIKGTDKYQALARKNPNLHTLKNRFNLDIEY